MNAGVQVGLAEDAIRIDVRRRRSPQRESSAGVRRAERRRQQRGKSAPRAVALQPRRGSGPRGVRGPGVSGQAVDSVGSPRRSDSMRAAVQPVVLTDRGLALAMVLIVSLVIAAVFCITTTALRVTGEPNSPAPVIATR